MTFNNLSSSFLLPIDSSEEEMSGVAHLLEHVLIVFIEHVLGQAKNIGQTVEDYIMLLCDGIELETFLDILNDLRFNDDIVNTEKEMIRSELKFRGRGYNEIFFRKVWENTDYEKSPLGDLMTLSDIGIRELETLKRKILRNKILNFSKKSGINIGNPCKENDSIKKADMSFLRSKHLLCFEKEYKILFFDKIKEEVFVLVQVLKILNPNKHIQISEKLTESALIIENDCMYPKFQEIKELKKEAMRIITNEIAEIKESFYYLSINELESRFFYNKSWKTRIKLLRKTNDRALFNVLSDIREKLQ